MKMNNFTILQIGLVLPLIRSLFSLVGYLPKSIRIMIEFVRFIVTVVSILAGNDKSDSG